jgi:hypothetical protein
MTVFRPNVNLTAVKNLARSHAYTRNMTGYSLKALIEETGYFHLWLAATKRNTFFAHDFEKGFFLSQLQRLLSSGGQGSDRPFPVELLAFSLTSDGAHLLVYTSRKPILEHLCHTLIQRFSEYLVPSSPGVQLRPLLIIDSLAGAHEALSVSREIHLLNEDWLCNRYSSIGYYLGEQRASWMHIHRLSKLFHHSPANYRKLLESRPTESDHIFDFIET